MSASEFKSLNRLLLDARRSLLIGLSKVNPNDRAWRELDDADRLLYTAMVRIARAAPSDFKEAE